MLFEVTVPQFTKMLRNLSAVLEKAALFAEQKKVSAEVILNSRLAVDQFHLVRQVQIACDTAKLATSRLTGKEAPVHDDSEKSFADLQNRIAQTVAFMGTINKNDFLGSEERKISQPRWEGKYLSGYEYALQHALPNLYFHVTTAYSILRHLGVEIGKKDYLGEMPFKK